MTFKSNAPLLAALLLGLSACSKNETSNSNLALSSCSRTSALSNTITETAYCAGPTSYSNSVTIYGSAQFQAWKIDDTGSTAGLASVGTNESIKYAEVQVKDSSGNLVQCGETGSDGSFSLQVPSSTQTYTLSVMTRANNTNLKASVMKCPEAKLLYSMDSTFTGNENQNLGTLIASATDGDILGGAFNILNQVLLANDFLRTKAGNCSGSFSGCQDFTVAPKAEIYWEKGFNPGTYSSGGPVSFYIPGTDRLFIVGGVSGDVNDSDTDHFDNSVILHEYAHFLDDRYTTSNSPGGSHDAQHVIDPRLAWGEGWGNFFQAAVRDHAYYIDTYGNPNGNSGEFFRIDLEDQVSPIIDEPTTAEEGNFREFSVTRALWDVLDNNNDSESVSDGFAEIWGGITSTQAFNHTYAGFRSVGFFHQRRDSVTSNSPTWTPLRTLAKHSANRSNYALWVNTTVNDCNLTTNQYSITPVNKGSDNAALPAPGGVLDNSFSGSHLLLNNDFFHYYHPGGAATFTMTFKTTSGTTSADLDLFVYKDSAVYGEDSSLVNTLSSDEGRTATTGVINTSFTETVSDTLAAGHYLINVKVSFKNRSSSAMGGPTDYELKANGVNLCADTFPNL